MSEDSDRRTIEIQSWIRQEQEEVKKKIQDLCQHLLMKKSRLVYHEQLTKRINAFRNYVHNIMHTFYNIISMNEHVEVNTEVTIKEKATKFKKDVFALFRKLTVNPETVKIEENIRENTIRHQMRRNKIQKKKLKGKNAKISMENALSMHLWMISKFQELYPSLEEKNMMAEEGQIRVSQVNNWFINMRERIIKKIH